MSGATRIDLSRSLRDGLDESGDLALQVVALRPEVPARVGRCICGSPIESGALSPYCGPCGRDLGAR